MKKRIPIGCKGQSTVEYLLLVTSVLAVVIFFLISNNAPYQAQLNATYTTATDEASNATQRLFCALDATVP